jgi:hypothetical protein
MRSLPTGGPVPAFALVPSPRGDGAAYWETGGNVMVRGETGGAHGFGEGKSKRPERVKRNKSTL